MPGAQVWVSRSVLQGKEPWLILGLGQEIPKMGLEHLVRPESKRVLQIIKQNFLKPQQWGYVKGPQEPAEEASEG